MPSYSRTCRSRIHLLISLILLLLLTTGQVSATIPPLNISLPPASPLLQFTAAGHLLGFHPARMILANPHYALQVEFVDANPVTPRNNQPSIEPGNPSPQIFNSKSKTQTLKSVTYSELWKDVTLIYKSSPAVIAKSTYIIAPEPSSSPLPTLTAKVNQIRLRYNVPVHLDPSGNLILEFETGHLRESAPIAWQEINGHHHPVDVRFTLLGAPSASIANPKSETVNRLVGFALGPHHPAYPLIIDPSLTWHTFLGSGDNDSGTAVALDEAGNVYVTGHSRATWGDNPINPHTNSADAFVAKLNSNGVRLWHTFLGSGNDDYGRTIAVDKTGNIYVAGQSQAAWGENPVNSYKGDYDVFVAKLNSKGGLQWHTFLGSLEGHDNSPAVTLDKEGNIYIAGYSTAAWGTPKNPHAGSYDAFVAKLNSEGIRQWHTFLGSSSSDEGKALTVDEAGNVYVTGWSYATWDAPLNAHAGGSDAFVAQLNSSGVLQWNTFLGSGSDDYARTLTMDEAENIYIAGWGGATWGTPVNPYTGSSDAFVAQLDSIGNLQWNTFLGSGSDDYARALTVDKAGGIYIAGESGATWGTPLNLYTGGLDAFVTKLNSDGTLQWNTFLGSVKDEHSHGITINEAGNIYIAGNSGATWGTPVNSHSELLDAFIAKISPPYVTDVAPPPNSHMAPLKGTLTLTYSLPISPATVNTSTLVVHAGQTGRLTPGYTLNNHIVKIIPSSPFKPGEIIQVTSNHNLLGAAYNENAIPHVWQFRTSVLSGTGIFSNTGQSLGGGDVSKIALGDLDGDNDLDAFMASAGDLTLGSPNKIWFNNSKGIFSDSGQNLGSKISTAVALGDLDADGDLDAFVGNGNTQTDEIWRNDGKGEFILSSSLQDSDPAYDVALGDLDADGDLDALVANWDGRPNKVWLNNGKGKFTHDNHKGYELGEANSLSVALGDLDGDGDLDAFIGNEAEPNEIWQNDGKGRFSLSQRMPNPYNSWDIALGDLDSDSDLDAFITNGGGLGQPDQVWFNEGTGHFKLSEQVLREENSRSVSLGDVDADGNLDALVADFAGSRVWYNNGDGSFGGGSKLTEGYSWSAKLGDLDGDGDLDAFFGNGFNRSNEMWLNQLAVPARKAYLPFLANPDPNAPVQLIINSLNTEGIDQIRIRNPATNKDVLVCGDIGNNITKDCGQFPPIGTYEIIAHPNKLGCGSPPSNTLRQTFKDAIGGSVVIRSIYCK